MKAGSSEFNVVTVGMKDLQPDTVQKFAKSLGLLAKNQVTYIDFNYNECFLRGRKKHLAIKYFLAGYIQATAKEANFITPAELRKYYGFGAKEKKYTLHEKLLEPTFCKLYNEHERDAYLLAKMGFNLKGNN
jgi:hypothetical protein